MDLARGVTGKANTFDGQMLAACNVADGIIASGPLESLKAPSRWFEAAGFLDQPIALVSGVNACLVGQIQDAVGQPCTIVAYRGTLAFDDELQPFGDRLTDWLSDMHIGQRTWHGAPWTVHRGFADAVDSLQQQIDVLIADDRPVRYCGHSKGGACAVLAATQRYLQTGRPTSVVTFGGPRCGGTAFANAFEQLPIVCKRYENHGDIVPHVPMNAKFAELLSIAVGMPIDALDYQSVGTLFYINADGTIESPKGMPGEVWLHAKAELAIAEFLAEQDFVAIREAHGIDFNHGYSRATAPEVVP